MCCRVQAAQEREAVRCSLGESQASQAVKLREALERHELSAKRRHKHLLSTLR